MTIQSASSVDPQIDRPARTPSKTAHTALLALFAAVLCLFVVPSTTTFASGGGGGGVAGKCGTITSISASPVTLRGTTDGYTASALQIRGQVNNCSIYLQRYWIDFSEPTNTNTDCKAAFSVFPTTVWSSGSTQSWSASRTITNAPTTSPQDCVGEHTLNAVLRSRTDGSVLDTASITYTVSL